MNLRIGVIVPVSQRPIVEEFFQLFKVPWEFCREGISYNILLVTDHTREIPPASLVIISGAASTAFDLEHGFPIRKRAGDTILVHDGGYFPVYGETAIFDTGEDTLLRVKDLNEVAAFTVVVNGRKVVRLGYDLFEECAMLLKQGQPAENALIPTLEIHLDLLRTVITQAGLHLLEIPPIPAGYGFTVCLTHDVDFLGIRDHLFDRSIFGFLLRGMFPLFFRNLRQTITWRRFARNLKAIFSLPGVYLGLLPDPWFDVKRYQTIEKGLNATYFFIPFKGQPGNGGPKRPPRHRGTRYDVREHTLLIKTLLENGHEIGLHGIDAWQSGWQASRELEVISQITGEGEMGVRIHWLYFSEGSPAALDEAGFLYDSTIGFNEAIGFRAGTAQAFRPPGVSRMLELPLIIMDTALFSYGRMALSEAEAQRLCKEIIFNLRLHGGALTVNWHTRSLNPERNWDDFYLDLLSMLEAEGAWFTTGGKAARWFNKRRAAGFDDISLSGENLQVKLSPQIEDDLPGLLMRIHFPTPGEKRFSDEPDAPRFKDLEWSGESVIEQILNLSPDFA